MVYKGTPGEQIEQAQNDLYEEFTYITLKDHFPFIKKSDFKYIPFNLNLSVERINNYKKRILYPRNI